MANKSGRSRDGRGKREREGERGARRRGEKPGSWRTRQGLWTELRFMSEAARRGFTVMRPISWGSVYDILLSDAGEGFQRVQVKSSGRPRDPRWRRGQRGELYIFDTRRRDGAYRAADLDFYALYIIPRDTWYIIPFEAIGPVEVLCVYPDNPRHRLEEYREAWHLLRKEKVVEKLRDAREMKARARKKIVVVEEG